MKRLVQKFRQPKALPLLIFVVGFAVVGVVMLFQSFAAGNSTISGVFFVDSNRNGQRDPDEQPVADKVISIFDAVGKPVPPYGVATDVNGNYSLTGLSDSNYQIGLGVRDWWEIRENWMPTTTGSLFFNKDIALNGTAAFDFGMREIVRSRTLGSPISSVRHSSGMLVESYNDAVTAQEVLSTLRSGSLHGAEAQFTELRFDFQRGGKCTTSIGGSPGTFSSFSADVWVDWLSWINDGERTLFHEYGHAFANYHDYIVQQDGTYSSYLVARGISLSDPRLRTSHAWDPSEMIVEDYRLLFGTPSAQAYPQENTEIPLAKDVPGLLEYLRDVFTKPPATTAPPAPSSNLTGTTSLTPEGPAVQLNWGASTGAATYDIYRNNVKIGYVNAPSTTYYDGSNLTYSTSYSYYVKPVSSSGTVGTASNTVGVTTPAPDTTKPSVPTGLMSTGSTNSTVSLQWMAATDNVGVKEYRIYQDSRKLQPVLKGTATGTNFTVTGLKFNSGYMFYVTAVDAAGNESLPSKTISVKTRR